MCSIASFFGEPISYLQEREGKIFQDVFPTPEHANELSSRSFSAALGLHVVRSLEPSALMRNQTFRSKVPNQKSM